MRVEIRSFESVTAFHEQRATIRLKYTVAEVKTLQKMGKLTERSSSKNDPVVFVGGGEAAVEQDDEQGGGENYLRGYDLPPTSEDDE